MGLSAAWTIGAKALLGLAIAATAVFGTGEGRPSTATYVDLDRYDGRWYTIASLPAWFEKNCTGSTTDYTLLANGQLKVVNSCYKGSLDGPLKKFEGKAWVVEPGTNSKLKVRFSWLATSDFWIFDVSPDYEHAVIGTPNHKYLWIISRTPHMDEATYGYLVAKAAQQGFDTSRLKKTLHAPVQQVELPR